MKIALLSIALIAMFYVGDVSAQSTDRQSTDNSVSTTFEDQYNANKWDYFLYPVPASDEINVKVTKGQVNIYQINITDEFGNGVLEMIDLSTDKIKVDISSLLEGKYFMQIIADDKKSVKMKRFYVAN